MTKTLAKITTKANGKKNVKTIGSKNKRSTEITTRRTGTTMKRMNGPCKNNYSNNEKSDDWSRNNENKN